MRVFNRRELISLDYHTNLDEVIAELQENTVTREALIFVRESFSFQDHQDILRVFEAIGRLSLERIEVTGGGRSRISVAALNLCLSSLPSRGEELIVKELKFHFLEFTGHETEFLRLVSTLSSHAVHLEKFVIQNCSLPYFQYFLDSLVSALGMMTTMECLEISGDNRSADERCLSQETLHLLANSPSLKKVTLYDFFSFQDEEIALVFREMESNPRIQELAIALVQLDDAGAENLGKFLGSDNAVLTKLEIFCTQWPSPVQAQSIVNGLKNNTTLKYLYIDGGFRHDPEEESQEAFVDMISSNFALENLEFDMGKLRGLTDFYLTLNRAGRMNLLTNDKSSREDWINALVTVRKQIECSYYFLRTNPSLMNVVS